MPITPTYPGVYIEELPSGVRTIVGVATSVTAFVGTCERGPTDTALRIASFGEFERSFGGLSYGHPMTYSVYHYFQNGGSLAYIVRVTAAAAVSATATLSEVTLTALGDGAWGNRLRATIDLSTSDSGLATPQLFNLTVTLLAEDLTTTLRVETFRNLSVVESHPSFVTRVLAEESLLVRGAVDATPARPSTATNTALTTGADGTAPTAAEITGSQSARTGMYALDNVDLFNLLVFPGTSRTAEATYGTNWAPALAYCRARRAILLAGPLSGWTTATSVETAASTAASGLPGLLDPNAAVVFPRVNFADPLLGGRAAAFDPTGALAGIIARTDAARGVWKAPAGLDAKVSGSRGSALVLTDSESGLLNQIGVNCLRDFNLVGTVVWGSRTGAGADRLASEWKYLPVRRTALFLEESLYRGLQWAVFEPNDEPLWAQIRLNVTAFMHSLFRQGAFQGSSPKDAYLVKCDRETTTQDDINRGIVNVLVGFAPLKPAEFVILKIQQLAGQAAA